METQTNEDTTKKTTTRKRSTAPKGDAKQAAAPKAPAGKANGKGPATQAAKPARKPSQKKAPAGKGPQQQGSGLAGMDAARAHLSGKGSAGATTADPQSATQSDAGDNDVRRGGAKQAVIEVRKIPGRGGRPQGPEDYPFSELEPAKKVRGEIEGPSFFIPKTDNPDSHLATARKRYKDRKFWSRNTMIDGVPGMLVWRQPLDA